MKLYESIQKLDKDIEFYRIDNSEKFKEIEFLEKQLNDLDNKESRFKDKYNDVEGLELICQIKIERIKYLKEVLKRWKSLIEELDESL